MKSISISLEEETAGALEEISKSIKKSKDDIVNEAIRSYIEYDVAYLKAVQEGLDDVKNGRVVKLEEVVKEFKNRGYKLGYPC